MIALTLTAATILELASLPLAYRALAPRPPHRRSHVGRRLAGALAVAAIGALAGLVAGMTTGGDTQ